MHPPDDSDGNETDDSIRYRRPRQQPFTLGRGPGDGYEENGDVGEDVNDDDDKDIDDDVNADDDYDEYVDDDVNADNDEDDVDVSTIADGGVGDGDSEGSMGTVVPGTQLSYWNFPRPPPRFL